MLRRFISLICGCICTLSCNQDPLIDIDFKKKSLFNFNKEEKAYFNQLPISKFINLNVNGKKDLKLSFSEGKENSYNFDIRVLNFPKIKIKDIQLENNFKESMNWKFDTSSQKGILKWMPSNVFNASKLVKSFDLLLKIHVESPYLPSKSVLTKKLQIYVNQTHRSPVLKSVEFKQKILKETNGSYNFFINLNDKSDLRVDLLVFDDNYTGSPEIQVSGDSKVFSVVWNREPVLTKESFIWKLERKINSNILNQALSDSAEFGIYKKLMIVNFSSAFKTGRLFKFTLLFLNPLKEPEVTVFPIDSKDIVLEEDKSFQEGVSKIKRRSLSLTTKIKVKHQIPFTFVRGFRKLYKQYFSKDPELKKIYDKYELSKPAYARVSLTTTKNEDLSLKNPRVRNLNLDVINSVFEIKTQKMSVVECKDMANDPSLEDLLKKDSFYDQIMCECSSLSVEVDNEENPQNYILEKICSFKLRYSLITKDPQYTNHSFGVVEDIKLRNLKIDSYSLEDFMKLDLYPSLINAYNHSVQRGSGILSYDNAAVVNPSSLNQPLEKSKIGKNLNHMVHFFSNLDKPQVQCLESSEDDGKRKLSCEIQYKAWLSQKSVDIFKINTKCLNFVQEESGFEENPCHCTKTQINTERGVFVTCTVDLKNEKNKIAFSSSLQSLNPFIFLLNTNQEKESDVYATEQYHFQWSEEGFKEVSDKELERDLL